MVGTALAGLGGNSGFWVQGFGFGFGLGFRFCKLAVLVSEEITSAPSSPYTATITD